MHGGPNAWYLWSQPCWLLLRSPVVVGLVVVGVVVDVVVDGGVVLGVVVVVALSGVVVVLSGVVGAVLVGLDELRLLVTIVAEKVTLGARRKVCMVARLTVLCAVTCAY